MFKLILLIIAVAVSCAAAPVDYVLSIGPVAVQMPAFADDFTIDDLAKIQLLNPVGLTPEDGDQASLKFGNTNSWTVEPGNAEIITRFNKKPSTIMLGFYLECTEFRTPVLTVNTAHKVVAWLDGQSVALDEGTAKLKLTPGKHVVLLQATRDPEVDEKWIVAPQIDGDVVVSTSPARHMTINDALDYEKISSASVSDDGTLAIVNLGRYTAESTRESWLEIINCKTGALVDSWRANKEASQVKWIPGSNNLSWVTRADEKATVWKHNLATKSTTVILSGVEKFGGYSWSPTGEYIIYSVNVDAEKDDREVKRMQAIEDRWTWWRNSSYLVQSFVGGGSRRLTAGKVSANNWKINPDGTKLLFFRNFPHPGSRPYSRSELWEMDLTDLSTTLILEDPWIGDAAYGPDPDLLALTGSPSAFDGLGRDLPDGVTPNDYGGQVYLYNRLTKTAEPISKNFDPSLGGIQWHSSGLICATALNKQCKRLAVYVPGGQWQIIVIPVEVISNTSFARSAPVALVAGTSVTEPKKLFAVNLETNNVKVVASPGDKQFADVSFGKVRQFTPTLANGEILDGRVYYPINYDPEKKYPVIVYYYGGTSPITRDFGGRYPKNCWAAEDYFVYIPIPSGSLGYGQEFSARHVNDWGKLTAGEVIEGTKAFLDAHPAADADHIGCMGASYGGFLTMYLTTQTDMFTCAISHAGISSITGYWAEGYWGYSYGSRALAHSFPWNNPDLYVNQSPLTHADQVNTPLLLLHGTDDTNVPKGESDGMYIALKLLGKDVEYVRVDGQDHHILDHEKRIVWHNTIMSYFSKYLKEDSRWWDEMYQE